MRSKRISSTCFYQFHDVVLSSIEYYTVHVSCREKQFCFAWETTKLEGKQKCFPREKTFSVLLYSDINKKKKKNENELTPISIVSVGFSVAILLLKPPYEIQKMMQYYFW